MKNNIYLVEFEDAVQGMDYELMVVVAPSESIARELHPGNHEEIDASIILHNDKWYCKKSYTKASNQLDDDEILLDRVLYDEDNSSWIDASKLKELKITKLGVAENHFKSKTIIIIKRLTF